MGFKVFLDTNIFLDHLLNRSEYSKEMDAFQYYTALGEKGMNYFITQNIKDFKDALDNLPVLNSEQFLKEL